jgi:hypothetical protein
MSCGWQAASRGRPMGSCSPFLTVHRVTMSLPFFCCRSIRWRSADSLRRDVWLVITILHSPPLVERWPSTGLSIDTVPVSGGDEQYLSSGAQYGWGLAWTPDGRAIVFAKAGFLANAGWLWKISARGGEPERLQFGQGAIEPSIRGNRLVYARQELTLNIWRRKLDSLLCASGAHYFAPTPNL